MLLYTDKEKAQIELDKSTFWCGKLLIFLLNISTISHFNERVFFYCYYHLLGAKKKKRERWKMNGCVPMADAA